MKKLFILLLLIFSSNLYSEEESITKVGVLSVFSGEFSIAGQEVSNAFKTYNRLYLRHPIKFIYEDAKIGSQDGLKAFEKLINISNVDLTIAASSTNSNLAAKELINRSKTPNLVVSTAGESISSAGEYFFRFGTNDMLNGSQSAQYLYSLGYRRVVLLVEETEYTNDVTKHFSNEFESLGGKIIISDSFLPDTSDFKSIVTKIKSRKPDAVFVASQTGLSFALFLKEWQKQKGEKIGFHTTFVAAGNIDALKIAGDFVKGTTYLAPSANREFEKYKYFFNEYLKDHKQKPNFDFIVAGVVDVMDIFQAYLDQEKVFNTDNFIKFLNTYVQNYKGLTGNLTLDERGNTNIGFIPAMIE